MTFINECHKNRQNECHKNINCLEIYKFDITDGNHKFSLNFSELTTYRENSKGQEGPR